MKRVFIIVVIILVSLLTGCGSDTMKKEVTKISSQEVREMISNGIDAVIIDVRTKEEFDARHIVGAINVPLDQIEEIELPKSRKIILYCQSGNRSNQAANILNSLGYENVFDLGGINYWPYETE